MDEQAQAIRLLKQARATIAKRLARRLMADQEGILEDAGGHSYMDEINTVYQQLGQRLHQVNEMISDLTMAHSAAAPALAVLALPAPRAKQELSRQTGMSLQAAAAQLHSTSREQVAQLLTAWFGIDRQLGLRCAEHFANQVSRNPELLLKSMQLRSAVASCRYGDALLLLQECFGLPTAESRLVLRNLAVRFGRQQPGG